MQAILTRYHGPSNRRGSRISASCQAGRIYVEYDDALNVDNNHAEAVRALLKKLGWAYDTYGGMHGGQLPSGDYAWVFSNDVNELHTFAPDVA